MLPVPLLVDEGAEGGGVVVRVGWRALPGMREDVLCAETGGFAVDGRRGRACRVRPRQQGCAVRNGDDRLAEGVVGASRVVVHLEPDLDVVMAAVDW